MYVICYISVARQFLSAVFLFRQVSLTQSELKLSDINLCCIKLKFGFYSFFDLIFYDYLLVRIFLEYAL